MSDSEITFKEQSVPCPQNLNDSIASSGSSMEDPDFTVVNETVDDTLSEADALQSMEKRIEASIFRSQGNLEKKIIKMTENILTNYNRVTENSLSHMTLAIEMVSSKVNDLETLRQTCDAPIPALKKQCNDINNSYGRTPTTRLCTQPGSSYSTCPDVPTEGFSYSRESTPNNHTSASTKMRPPSYNGTEELEDYLAQFEVLSELNRWDYKTKSLYLASSLDGSARSLLNELSHEKRRDYDSLVQILNLRFGSTNRSEIFKATLQTRTKQRNESISDVAQSIKKL
ncbi:hypothetical protein SNE40_017855 [Patella caerulea]|uniref:Uncharacterized protein n=1 Tax=Patella caerulea TaxID=87958 RepID=A0AAN8PQH4_PATCE